jgi:hypothetical protein
LIEGTSNIEHVYFLTAAVSFHFRPRRHQYVPIFNDDLSSSGHGQFVHPDPDFQLVLHQIHGHDDGDDDDDAIAAKKDSVNKYMDNLIKSNRARLGLPMPKAWNHPFGRS